VEISWQNLNFAATFFSLLKKSLSQKQSVQGHKWYMNRNRNSIIQKLEYAIYSYLCIKGVMKAFVARGVTLGLKTSV
jgi:hypothetical protein